MGWLARIFARMRAAGDPYDQTLVLPALITIIIMNLNHVKGFPDWTVAAASSLIERLEDARSRNASRRDASARAGLQHAARVERTRAFLELSRQNMKAALQGAARAAMSALLQLIGEPADDQIATEAQRQSGVMQRPPGAPQLLGRAIDQPDDFAINLGQVLVVKPVPSGVVWTETGERLAGVLASRSIADWRFHTLAGSAMR